MSDSDGDRYNVVSGADLRNGFLHDHEEHWLGGFGSFSVSASD